MSTSISAGNEWNTVLKCEFNTIHKILNLKDWTNVYTPKNLNPNILLN